MVRAVRNDFQRQILVLAAMFALVILALSPVTAPPSAAPLTLAGGVPSVIAVQSSGAPSGAYSETVWTVGWQDEIDACSGAVDIGAYYGTPVIAEHWFCGGSMFPGEGSTIILTGVVSGTFRVGSIAAVLNAATDNAGAIPHGFDLLYQTCVDGSSATMSFTELTRIG
ncbi:hypothetical protein [Cryobacterium ruanii]|uniref:Uncharacterized protein n=1 Tax=Cryobacterium ruanii TaxID=1259197 RepID=A0A4R9ANX3_9MICO|nr:hypothetical protein [Cryobacterium ruanii]TFD66745.1 hypothetical protein E3T47_06110 [Cryobacterium ruanii]